MVSQSFAMASHSPGVLDSRESISGSARTGHGLHLLMFDMFPFRPLCPPFRPLLAEFGLDCLGLVVVAAAALAKQRFDAVQELLLPLADLAEVDLVSSRQLGEGLCLLGGL
jgi:hypothetical protein